MERNFDITAIQALVGEQFEGHAYSFIHRRFMANGAIPIVPVLLNTYYPPNQPSPRRCFDLGVAIRELVQSYPESLRVGILASGGLSHFLVNEELDGTIVEAIRRKDHEVLKSLPVRKLATARRKSATGWRWRPRPPTSRSTGFPTCRPTAHAP